MVKSQSEGAKPHVRNALHELGYKIFLDRYAQKDMTRATLQVGDTVIVVVDPATGQREIGKVTAMKLPQVTIELLDGEVVTRDLEHVDKPLETTPEQMMERVARGIASVETTPELQAQWTERFQWLLDDWKFVPAGRILAAAGTEQELTFYNCYVLPSARDSREGIIETLRQMTEIMSRGGGVGINISTLRPRHAYVKGVNGRSSGAVSWGALYSFVTGLIEQGGCFGPDERILTNIGLIPARELADRVEAGEPVQAQTHRGLRRITSHFRNGVKPLYEVMTHRGFRVQITEDHKVAVLMDGKITTMPLKYLHEGDEILLLLGDGVQKVYVPLKAVEYQRSIMSTTLNTNVRTPDALHEDLAYLVGYMHGDGYVHWGKKVNWTAPKAIKMATADTYPQIRQRIIDAVQDVFGLKTVVEDGDGACKSVCLYSRVVVEWLIGNGLLKAKAEDIRVPEAIFRSPSSVMAAFIAGYFDADGCNRGRKGGYGIDSISREMLEDVQQLLAINGILSSIRGTDRSAQGWQTIYRLTITGGEFKKRFTDFVSTAKRSDDMGKREMYNTYPAEVWTTLGARSKYRQRIHDGVSERISFGQLARIGERLLSDGQVTVAQQVDEIMHTIPDEIASITLIGDSDVYDFEVDDVHLLSGAGIYTSNSRRGALMLILNDWHPDIFDFINSKRTMGQITNANISVGVSDKLMEAVKADADWDLVFPDTNYPDYTATWDGDLEKWIAAGRRVVKHRTVKARALWNAIIESAWASAEPGVWFNERANKMSNSFYFNPLICTNPCGEQSIGAWSVCNLGAINLAKFYDEAADDVAWDDLRLAAAYGAHFLDNVIDATPYFFEENRQRQMTERRVGLGIMGLAELMVKLGIRYGSDEGIAFTEKLFKFLTEHSYLESARIAAEKGTFSEYDERFLQSGFMQRVKEELPHVYETIEKQGMRNVTVLTVAPTGTTGTMVNTSTGIEPFFSWVYYRKSRLGLHEEQVPLVKEWYEKNPDAQKLPDYFVAAMDLAPEEHVRMQAAAQKWVDSSISKCVVGDTLILTDEGPQAIEELSEWREVDQFTPLNLRVATSNGQSLASAFYYNGMRATIKVKLAYGYELEGTTNHPIRILQGDGSTAFKQLSELKVGDIVPVYMGQRKFGQPNKSLPSYTGTWETTNTKQITIPTHMTNELAYLLGCVTSEGSIGRNSVYFVNGERHLVERVAALFESLFGIRCLLEQDKRRESLWYVRANSRVLVRWLTNDLGLQAGARNKIIPPCILTSAAEEIGHFLRGLFLDAYMTNDGRMFGIGLASLKLLKQLQVLFLNFGIVSRLHKANSSAWVLTLAGESLNKLAQITAFEEVWKNERISRRNDNRQMPVRDYATMLPTSISSELYRTIKAQPQSLRSLYVNRAPDYQRVRVALMRNTKIRRDDAREIYGSIPHLDSNYLKNFFSNDSEQCIYLEIQALQSGFAEVFDITVPGEHEFIANGVCNHNTANLPKNYTVEQVSDLYQYMYELGCKGGTIYRDGSRDEQVLMLKGDERAEKEMDGKVKARETEKIEQTATPHRVYPRPEKLSGATVKCTTPFGTAYVTMNSDDQGYPFEIFVTAPGKAGSDLQADAEGLGRMISLALRTTAPQNRLDMLRLVIEQLKDIGGTSRVGFGPSRVNSLPDAVANVLQNHYFADNAPQQMALPINGTSQPASKPAPVSEKPANGNGKKQSFDICPSCGNAALVHAEGCSTCTACGYSKC